jgi:hypothetical protein
LSAAVKITAWLGAPALRHLPLTFPLWSQTARSSPLLARFYCFAKQLVACSRGRTPAYAHPPEGPFLPGIANITNQKRMPHFVGFELNTDEQ